MARGGLAWVGAIKRVGIRHLPRALLFKLGFRWRTPVLFRNPIFRIGCFQRSESEPTGETSGAHVAIIAPIYRYYPVLLPSLLLQTHTNWSLLLIHDGPDVDRVLDTVATFDDPRVKFMETDIRHDDWGHTLRQVGLNEVAADDGVDYVVITNADNYYAPAFLTLMLKHIRQDSIGVYCDFVHSHRGWTYLQSRLRHAYIDCGCLLVRKDAAVDVGWSSREFGADWIFTEDLMHRYGASRLHHVDRVLFVHN